MYKFKCRKSLTLSSLMLLALLCAPIMPAHAQNEAPMQAPVSETDAAENPAAPKTADITADEVALEQDTGQFDRRQYESLVFTQWEIAAIQDARSSRGVVRDVTDAELDAAFERDDLDYKKPEPKPEEREISLGGIVYHGYGDWTIWLNEKRITPDALPKEVLDLRVFSKYIEMKWFDEYTNQIFPIRLRPHQRFNMDARMFLPG